MIRFEHSCGYLIPQAKPESFLCHMNVLQFREPVKSAINLFGGKCLRYEMLPESLFRRRWNNLEWLGSLSSHNRWSDNGRYCSKEKRLVTTWFYCIFLFFQMLEYISSYSFLALTLLWVVFSSQRNLSDLSVVFYWSTRSLITVQSVHSGVSLSLSQSVLTLDAKYGMVWQVCRLTNEIYQ